MFSKIKNLILKIVISFFTVFAIMIFFNNSASASTLASENFSSFGSHFAFYNYPFYLFSTSTAHSAPNAMRASYIGHELYYVFTDPTASTTKNTVTQYIKIYTNGSTATQRTDININDQFGYGGGGTIARAQITKQSGSSNTIYFNFFYSQNAGYRQVAYYPTGNEWAKLTCSFDLDNNHVFWFIDDVEVGFGDFHTNFNTGKNKFYGLIWDNSLNNAPYIAIDDLLITDTFFNPEYQGVQYYDDPSDTFLQGYPKITTVNSQICWLNTECKLWVYYNNPAVGGHVYLTPDVQYQQTPDYALASSTLLDGLPQYTYMLLPQKATSTKIDYCVYYKDAYSGYGDQVNCGITISYESTSTFEARLDDSGLSDFCNPLNICSDLSSTTEPLYSIACGARYIGCWLVVPSSSAKRFAVNTISGFEANFPFNTFFSITNAFNTSLTNSASTSPQVLSIPFIRKTATGSEYYLLPVLATTSMANAIGQSNYNMYRTTIGYVMWVATAGFLLLIIFFII
jgi:hypothetical protein